MLPQHLTGCSYSRYQATHPLPSGRNPVGYIFSHRCQKLLPCLNSPISHARRPTASLFYNTLARHTKHSLTALTALTNDPGTPSAGISKHVQRRTLAGPFAPRESGALRSWAMGSMKRTPHGKACAQGYTQQAAPPNTRASYNPLRR